MLFEIKKGIDIPVSGAPLQQIENMELKPARYALLASEYQDLKPLMKVDIGDRVARGQELFVHKHWNSIRFLSPVAGTVSAIHRGERRVLQSVEITPEGDDCEAFTVWDDAKIASAPAHDIASALQLGGLWQAFKTRPFGKIPAPDSAPQAIFVTAIDTRPLAADPQVIVAEYQDYFDKGLQIITRLTAGNVYLCVAQGSTTTAKDHPRIKRAEFSGPHPAGLAGTHIHLLEPVSQDKTVWSVNYQDVIAIGELFCTGVYPVARVVALAGPSCKNPRLIRTQLGTPIEEICRGQIETDNVRIVSGSLLDGQRVDDHDALAYVGRFQQQIVALPDQGERKLLAWIRPGLKLFSVTRAFLPSALGRALTFSCMQNGSERAVVPIGLYERVLPLDMLATPLLKALLVTDTEMAQKLGCLELDEEDLALCTYVCPSKYEFGTALRNSLQQIEKEG